MSMAASLQQDADFSKLVFLVVDDKPFYRDMAHTAVMRAGAGDVKHAASVDTALQILGRAGQAVDCIILDWDILPVSGLDLVRMIRTHAISRTPPETPVIILTGRADTEAVRAAKALDVNGFVLAPLSLEKLVKTIGNGISRTWTLQDAGVYARVPSLTPSLAAPEKRKGGPPSGVIVPRARAAHGGVAGARSAQAHFRDRDLKNVRVCRLDDVQPGAILARDLHDGAGHLLLKAGAELKPPLLTRLSGVAAEVWVGEWEAAPKA